MATTIIQYDATSFDGDSQPVQAGDLAAIPDYTIHHSTLLFPDGASESAAITRAVEMPTGYQGGALTAHIGYLANPGTVGDVDWEVQVEARSPGDSMATGVFDTVNSVVVTPAGTQLLGIASVTLTNKASVTAGKLVRFLVRRDSDDAADTLVAGAQLLWLAIEEA